MNTGKKSLPIKSIVQVSLLIALALVIRNLSYMVYFGGAPGMRVGFSGVFTKITAILFGPVLGGTASGIVDILGCLIKPEGAYIPWLTVTAILGGVITGVLWKLASKIDLIKFKRFFLAFIVIIGMFGIANHIFINYIPDSYWAKAINKLGKYKDFTSVGLEVISGIGFIFFIADIIIKKVHSKSNSQDDFLKIVITTGVSGIIVTTLNTFILRIFIPALGKKGFILFWVPRVIEEIFMIVIQAYIISILITIYKKHILTK
ncbi:MAG: folate family ECF transporter S component [Clostridiaceae bacterium]